MFSLLLPFALLWMTVSSELLSRGKPTTHTSFYPGTTWVSALAVDGGYHSAVNKQSCFISNNDKKVFPSMIVDLQGTYAISNIILYNRLDCCPEKLIGVTIELLSKANKVTHVCGVTKQNSNIYDIPCGNKLAEKVGIRQNKDRYLQICELEVHGEQVLSLLSRGKPTFHSSAYSDMGSPLAVDGKYLNYVNKDEEYDLKNCFVSNEDELPFFVVDLKGTFQIERIVVYNREDCCSDRMIGAVVELLYANGELSHECAKITEDLPIYNISCGNNVAQKIRVVGTPENYLQLCEVDVFGRPQSFPQLISRNKPTTQSSAMGSLNAALTVDGNYRNFITKQGDTSLGNCFQSDNDELPFMEVDLLGKFYVDSIVLNNRMDCCSERIINATVDLLFQNGSLSHNCGVITNIKATYNIPCEKRPANKVRVTGAPKGILQICELDVFGESALPIISRGKPTTSSSVYEDMESSFAVDGKYEYDFSEEEGVKLFHSDEDEQPFWEVDLQGKFNIEHVVIYNRMDCCSNRIIDAVIELLTETGEVSYECGKVTDIRAVYKIPCGNNVASKVRVKIPSKKYLHFSEVVVYGEKVE